MLKFRILQKKDIHQVRDVALKSWRFAYKDIYKEKRIQKEVSSYYSDKNFEKYFRGIKKGTGHFIAAVLNNKIIGYAHVTKEKGIWEIIRIYIDPKIIRKGIGSKLILNGEKFLKTKKAKRYVVYPHPKNKIAINFYKKVGFVRNPKFDRQTWCPRCFEKKI